MGFFNKTEEEKRLDEERRLKKVEEAIKKAEERILNDRVFNGKVGHIHQGLSYGGVWGVRDNGKMKFKSTKFRIYDDKFIIERNKMVVEYINIKEVFQEKSYGAIIILNNGDGVPIEGGYYDLRAFVNVLNRLIEENKSNADNIVSNGDNNESISVNSEDKFDKLIKLGEMHDKGLLSDEEFDLLKKELLSGNNAETTTTLEDDVGTSENICENCGAEVEEDSKFCAECGTQIKF